MKKILMLVSVFVIGLTLVACGPAEVTCDDGYVEVDGSCELDKPVCTDEEVYNEETNECDPKPLNCTDTQYEQNGACVDSPVCDDDQELSADKKECVSICPDGEVYSFGECIPEFTSLPSNVEGRIDLLLWSGTDTYWADLGKLDLIDYCPQEDEPGYDPDCEPDLTGQNDAAAYAVAKAFNAKYPNVVINVLAVAGGPNDGDRVWAQEIRNYEETYGAHPSVWASTDLPTEVSRGLVADLSQFQNDPLYRAMNPNILQMMNYYGFQAGLPQYILPWGIFVNKELAINNNITVPGFDWTIDEYSQFIANSEPNVYYGSMDTPMRIIQTGVETVTKQLYDGDYSNGYVNLDSDQVRALIPYLNDWDTHSAWGNYGEDGEITDEFWNTNGGWGGWGFSRFMFGTLLTLEGDPWMMGDCAHPDEDWWGTCKTDNWDIYPRPSTDYVDNNIGIVLDPMAVYNFCIEDGDLACTDEEQTQIQLSYEFAAFWIASRESFQARADQHFSDNGIKSSALNDSFPVVRGDEFNAQMQIWYTPLKHQRFSDPSLMPGFQEVIRLYEAGQFWDISDKAFPYFHEVEGARRQNLYEWDNYWNADINGGAYKGEPEFTDIILGNLGQWTADTNPRFQQAFDKLQEGLKIYYGFTDEDFQ